MTKPDRPRRCPVCGKPLPRTEQAFCSERCRQVDLGRWLSGGYAIPGEEVAEPGSDTGGQG